MKLNITCAAIVALCTLVCSWNIEPIQDEDSQFSRPTIDLGCVVSDIDATIKFYTEVVGFKESGGFDVTGEYCGEVGLTDNKPLNVKVLKLGEGPAATSLKVMQVEGGSQKIANDHVNTSLGFSYITVYVKSTEDANARLAKAGVKPLGKGPLPIANTDLGLTVIKDPDGNFVELVGPMKK